MDLMHLVQFVIAREEGEERQNFKVDAPHAPIVHLMIVVAVRQQALGRTIPSRANILGEGWLRVDTST